MWRGSAFGTCFLVSAVLMANFPFLRAEQGSYVGPGSDVFALVGGIEYHGDNITQVFAPREDRGGAEEAVIYEPGSEVQRSAPSDGRGGGLQYKPESWESVSLPAMDVVQDLLARDLSKVADTGGSTMVVDGPELPVHFKCGGSRCTVTPHGRGRYLYARRAQVNFENVTFSGWTAKGGGVVLLVDSNATFTNVRFVNNSATGGFFGGAVAAVNSTVVFRNCSFEGNAAAVEPPGSEGSRAFSGLMLVEEPVDGTGGLVSAADWAEYLWERSPSSQILHQGHGKGGAIAAVGSLCSIAIESCSFTLNTAGGGGAVYLSMANMTVERSGFTRNDAKVEGGALLAFQAPALLMSSVELVGNEVRHGCGGGVSLASGVATIVDSTFAGGSAELCGGAISLTGSARAQVLVSSVRDHASSAGGAACVQQASTLVLRGVTFSGTSSQGFGGGFFVCNGSSVLASNFEGSNMTAARGGAHAALSGGALLTAWNASMTRGTAGQPVGGAIGEGRPVPADGGGFHLSLGSGLWCSGCVISGNTATGGGGAAFLSGSSQFVANASQLSGNAAGGEGGASYLSEGSFASISGSEIGGDGRSLLAASGGSFLAVANTTVMACSESGDCQAVQSSSAPWAFANVDGASRASFERVARGAGSNGPELHVRVHGSGSEVFVGAGAALSLSGEGVEASECAPFGCLLEEEHPALCLSVPEGLQDKIESLEAAGKHSTCATKGPLLSGVSAAPFAIDEDAAGACSAGLPTPCQARSLMSAESCGESCPNNEIPIPDGPDQVFWAWIAVALGVSGGLLLAFAALWVAARRGWLRGALPSFRSNKQANYILRSNPMIGSSLNLAATADRAAQALKPSPDSDTYIQAGSPDKNSGGGDSVSIEDSARLASERSSDSSCCILAEKRRRHPAKGVPDLQVNFESEILPHLTAENFIGAGGFGEVYRMSWRGAPAAVKVFPKSFCEPTTEQYELYLKEVHLMAKFQDTPQIVRLLGASTRRPHMALVYELVQGGSLAERIHRGGALPLQETLKVGYDVAVGLSHLHPTIIHRDLKPGNVLIGSDGTCKLIDFGLSRGKDPFVSYVSTEAGGTPNYMAPEVFSGSRFNEKVDIYSLGMVLHECISGNMPWVNCSNMAQVIYQVAIQRERPEISPETPRPLAWLMRKCWDDEPHCRPSAPEVARVLKIMIDDGLSSDSLPAEMFEATPSETSSDTSTTQARTQLVLAAAAAACPEAESALRSTFQARSRSFGRSFQDQASTTSFSDTIDAKLWHAA
uniref:Serine threonine-protein kinase ctr1-like n=1 Tax=Tetraselmis sp. GSL018 TaxID=582737 RepID=A0A061SGJ2_9CHLO|eukprot:CAMPEP_0177616560 /NCGR_PEP_ID=MMETSP0419_2-20121207/24241_1 /TAXON_ID=582737 /ORGANISM="Tetraselmis sp., Strain GSL018" /LENGTH=1271 /DNA_ID=CAMNT_0019114667 /DNA_START=404 /DNA_END=4219 /DNA_ORIENTATION=-